MTVACTGIVIVDGWLDGSLTAATADDGPVQATLVALLVAAALGLGCMELSRLAAGKGLIVLNPASVIGVMLLATAWYWPQIVPVDRGSYVLGVIVVALLGVFVQQYLRFGTSGVLNNCGISCFTMIYLGLLGAFVLGVRIEFGLWEMFAVICVVKASDIGAYTFGRIFGRHKLAPRVSPGKTWEGMAGAMLAGMVLSFAFARGFGIMSAWPALVFGACLAVVGQLSDLVESMLKRDAGQKDSANCVPGFGGILDVIDSPLFATPFAYVFLKLVA
ncbi:MAG: phosphatidate cytidylyltransferase [Sedimentisphaerales bacterium]|nr:phosphatidate cytidylyltransferase [Sedimentisphaerales bacterium]